MKGYRFFVEYANKTEKGKSGKGAGTNHTGNVVAVLLEGVGRRTRYIYLPVRLDQPVCVECVSALYDWANSPVAYSGAAVEYLDEQCKRIPESVAREIHPELFRYLDSD